MLRLAPADLPPGAMSFAAQMFDPPHARLGLTPAEQRVALHALQGASDRTVAETLGLSTDPGRAPAIAPGEGRGKPLVARRDPSLLG
jgi:hypothetical protein